MNVSNIRGNKHFFPNGSTTGIPLRVGSQEYTRQKEGLIIILVLLNLTWNLKLNQWPLRAEERVLLGGSW